MQQSIISFASVAKAQRMPEALSEKSWLWFVQYLVLMAADQGTVDSPSTVDIRSVGSARFLHIVASRATIANW